MEDLYSDWHNELIGYFLLLGKVVDTKEYGTCVSLSWEVVPKWFTVLESRMKEVVLRGETYCTYINCLKYLNYT